MQNHKNKVGNLITLIAMLSFGRWYTCHEIVIIVAIVLDSFMAATSDSFIVDENKFPLKIALILSSIVRSGFRESTLCSMQHM